MSEGFSSVDELIDTDESELLAIEGFDEEIVAELDRAKKFLNEKESENKVKIETLKYQKT